MSTRETTTYKPQEPSGCELSVSAGSVCPVCDGDGIGEADDITPSGDIRQVSVSCQYCNGTGYTGQWNGNARAVMPVLCCDCDGIGSMPNAEVSEGGTRDSRIETAAQSRPSLH